jgi:hypothetical protein
VLCCVRSLIVLGPASVSLSLSLSLYIRVWVASSGTWLGLYSFVPIHNNFSSVQCPLDAKGDDTMLLLYIEPITCYGRP